jgi:hypothetical protein
MQQREGKAIQRLIENIVLTISVLLFLIGVMTDTVFNIFAAISEYNETTLQTMKGINFQAKAMRIIEEAKESIG